VTDERPGIRRRRRGRGFEYRLPDGTLLRDRDTRERIRALAIPPAWTDVWINPDPRGHLQATGRDVRGRKQYRYHPRWRRRRDREAGPSAQRHLVARAMRRTAERLGNTPAVAKASYVHPAVIDAFLDGSLEGDTLDTEPDDDDRPMVEASREETDAIITILDGGGPV